MVMDLEQALLQKLRTLPPEKRREVLDFVEFLGRRDRRQTPTEDLYGLWEDLDISISADDIADARREMWGNFPKGDV